MQRFYLCELPVASSMIKASRYSSRRMPDPLHQFVCYWIAFNNIYIKIADLYSEIGGTPRYKLTDETNFKAGVNVPKVNPGLNEHEQIKAAFREFDEALKHDLIVHAGTHFFVYRTPEYNGNPIYIDNKGQRLNGVLNVGKTIDVDHPVWEPIDTASYQRYMQQHDSSQQVDAEEQNALAEQLVWILYSVRNNTFHAGKEPDEESSQKVLRHAQSLLQVIVHRFIKDAVGGASYKQQIATNS